MRSAFAAVAFAALAAATPVPQDSASGCQSSYDGTFQIVVTNVSDSSLRKRQESAQQASLTLTLQNGVLKDDENRVGNLAANSQLQFDPEPQVDSIAADGFQVCANGRLALQDDDTFQQCLSGDFYNLYQGNTADQCNDVYIGVVPAAGAASPPSQVADGQVQAPTAPVSQIPDGQLQASTSAAPVTQIADGQIQASTAGAPVTQIGDGQIQAPTSVAAPVTQIGDGQIQAPTGAPVTQIGDGQIQAPTGAPVTQIDDGQIQAPTGAPVTQIPDGQIQAPTGFRPGNATVSSYPPIQTGAAASMSVKAGLMGLVAAVAAIAML